MTDGKPTVLLVEDDPFMSTLLSQELTKEGFLVDLATNGEDAIVQFKSHKPDVLLIDVLLPKKNGIEVVREIRATPEGATVPVIILSNLEEVAYLKAAEELGVKNYLIKANVLLPEIVAKVKEAMRQ